MMNIKKLLPIHAFISVSRNHGFVRYLSAMYVQGQYVNRNVREYFYYIDHQGQLFLDDSKIKNFVTSFKDKRFLQFFFKRIRYNDTGRYQEFPFMSLCGREVNYVRCDDRPVVFSQIARENASSDTKIYYAGDTLSVKFSPKKICMLPNSGRIYHPAPAKVGYVGLIKSSLAFELSSGFRYEKGSNEDSPPTIFVYKGMEYELDNQILMYLSAAEKSAPLNLSRY